jgi:hypothetical protein
MQRPLVPVFVTAVLAIGVYAALVQFLPFAIEKGQNQGDTNMLRAETYLAHSYSETVLVGSSLTFRLPLPVLGPHIANLAMAGGAPATGLALIARAETRPKLVLVEVNLLTRGADRTAVTSLLRFPERQLRAGLRAFRTGYDPVNLTERGLQALFHKSDEDPVPPPDAIRQLTADEQRTKSHPPDATSLHQSLAETASLVATLEARGIRVGFFEMPIDPSLTDLPGEKDLRQAVMKKFPKSRFCWLNLSVPGGAHTLDGIHLTTNDAALIAGQLVRQSAACLVAPKKI